MTEQEQLEAIRKLKEGIAKCLYEFEYSSGYWDTRMSVGEKVKWIAEADSLLRTVLPNLYLDTGEMTDEEIPYVTAVHLAHGHGNPHSYDGLYRKKFLEGVKAARARFVSIGEVMK